MKNSFDQYPPVMNANQLSEALGISRAGAYQLLHQENFPTLHIGKRLAVPKDKLILWIDHHSGGEHIVV